MPKVDGEKVPGMGFPRRENDPRPTRDLGILPDTRDLGSHWIQGGRVILRIGILKMDSPGRGACTGDPKLYRILADTRT